MDRPKSLPLWGRWQAEGLTEEASHLHALSYLSPISPTAGESAPPRRGDHGSPAQGNLSSFRPTIGEYVTPYRTGGH